ncbi:VanZ family protein [Duganella sp. 3397]|uniref:VanZ family protein n=1 Tax=Duganella sp. 3397 TaxID=2817732 RepID=UPI0028633151|nr:VanZ family protein [Duganella sp. 3397]MDR7047572.1 VanZ family protein [Duganella sp. 3397]
MTERPPAPAPAPDAATASPAAAAAATATSIADPVLAPTDATAPIIKRGRRGRRAKQPKPLPTPASKSSPLARAAFLAYLLLIIYASWFPFSGWQNQGLSPWIFLETYSMPRYWTKFDAITNVIGYIPLGTLLVYALYPHVRKFFAFLIGATAGVLVSGTMEAVQTFLPSRVSSNLDFWTNSAGCTVGALIGVLTVRRLLDRSQLQRLRQAWFAPHASQGLVLLALWPLAQIYPQNFLFGLGQILPILSDWLSWAADAEIDLASYIRPDVVLTVEQYWLSETIITACGMVGASLTLLCLLRKPSPRALLVSAMIASAILVKALASALLFAPENAFVWVTPGAEGGFLIGAIMLAGLGFAPHAAQRRVAVITLLLALVIINTTPANPYFVATLQTWVQGKFLNFNGAAQFLALLWPFFAIWFLWLPSHKLNAAGQGRVS